MLVRNALVAGLMLLQAQSVSARPSAAPTAGPTYELPGGGLAFAPNTLVTIESQDVVIAPDRITITYALRNSASTPQSMWLAFAMPALDANIFTGSDVVLATLDPRDYVRSKTLVDGQPAVLEVEQRPLALGIDITANLKAVNLPIFPYGEDTNRALEDMDDGVRLDLLERGILKLEGATAVPAWALKSVGYWRQTFEPEQTTTIVHSYQPIVGVADYKASAIGQQRKRTCLTPAQEAAIVKLPPNAGGPSGAMQKLTTLTYLATVGADALGPIGRFRVIIETPDDAVIVATCRQGFKRTGPMQLEWIANKHTPEEDLSVLFAR